MKITRLFALASLLAGLTLPSARADSGYAARQLFELTTVATGLTGRGLSGNALSHAANSVRLLNNHGEVLYAFGDFGQASVRPGLWLPKPNYGRAAGLNDLTAFPLLVNRSAMGFTDAGVFFTITADPSRPNDPLETLILIHRGTVDGESVLASAYRYENLPSLDSGATVRRQSYFVEGITLDESLLGTVSVEAKLADAPSTPNNWYLQKTWPNFADQGLFRDNLFIPVPGQLGLPACTDENQHARSYSLRACSPGGTLLVLRQDSCGGGPLVYNTLVVIGPPGERLVARSGVSPIPPEVDPLSSGLVNDTGDVAGLDQQGLWLSPVNGPVQRTNFTDITDFRFNQAGQFFFARTNGLHLMTDDGAITPLQLPWASFGYTPGFRLYDINERGEILVSATSSSNGKSYAVLLSPALSVRLTVSTNQVNVGETFTVTAALTSLSESALTGIAPRDSLLWMGTGEVKLISGPTPNPPLTLLPGAEATFQWRVQATQGGQGKFSAVMRAMNGTIPIETLPAISQAVKITAHVGDLLIKRVAEPPDSYAGGGLYQTVLNDPQIKTNAIPLGQDSQFQVQILNKDLEPQTFSLAMVELGDPGWQLICRLNGQDITAQLRVPGGAAMAALAASAALTLDVTMRPTNAPSGSVHRVDFTLGLVDDPQLTLDIVEAVAELLNEIVVNSTGDLPDKDPNDCCCDTGKKLADGVTPECTLRAAIQVANKRPGKDIIKFKIPGSDAGYQDGVPTIKPATALPDITDPVNIDGWSQNAGASAPPIQLSGERLARPPNPDERCTPGMLLESIHGDVGPNFFRLMFYPLAASGLYLAAPDSEIRGLVINWFPLCGILVEGDHSVIQGNYLGISPDGNAARASGAGSTLFDDSDSTAAFICRLKGSQICVRSAFNLIGGLSQQARNVISGIGGGYKEIPYNSLYPPGVLISGQQATHNVVQGNFFGLDSSGTGLSTVPPRDAKINPWGPVAGVMIQNASMNDIGGTDPAACNTFGGNYAGVWVDGPSATGNRILGNRMGTDASGTVSLRMWGGFGVMVSGLAVNTQIGGYELGAGNLILGHESGVTVKPVMDVADRSKQTHGGDGTLIVGNRIGGIVLIPGRGELRAVATGIDLSEVQNSLIERNLIVAVQGIRSYHGLMNRIHGNTIRHCLWQGIEGLEDQTTEISGNIIEQNGSTGTTFDSSGIFLLHREGSHRDQVTVSQNQIDKNFGLGLSYDLALGTNPTRNDIGDLDGIQNYPVLHPFSGAVLSGTQLKITGTLSTTLSGGNYVIEFFGNESANPSGYGEGQTFLGSATIPVGFSGEGDIDVTLPVNGNPGNYITATATAPDGSTSEFSKAVLIQDCVPGTKGLCPDLEKKVPGLGSGPGALSFVPGSASIDARSSRGNEALTSNPQLSLLTSAATSATGDGNGDGIQDYLQANVASLPSIAGVWITLSAPNGTTLKSVTPTGPPDFTNLPQGYTFPLGFLSFGITNLPVSGVVVMTNILHLDATTDFSYSLTTYFNYGPTPDNSTPHWYEFNFDGTTGAELLADQVILHFRDGARGDDDLTANGEIVTVGAPAYLIPPGPLLSLTSTVIGLGESLSIDATTFQLVTNQLPVVSSVLSWPASATNWTLYFKKDLTSSGSIPTNSLGAFLDFFWRPVPESPVVVNSQNIITNAAISRSRFFRLMQSSWSDARLTTEELAQGTYSWTGTGAWSNPANWSSTALVGGAPLSNGLYLIDVVFPAGGSPITSVVDGPYSVRSLTIPAGAPNVGLQSGGATASLTLGAGGLVQQGATNTTIQPPVTLAVDQTWLIGAGTLTVASLNLGLHSLTVTGAGHLIMQDLAGGAASRFAANGPGPVELGHAVSALTFLGTLAVAGGSVTSSQAMLNSAIAVELSGGTFNLPLNAILNSTTAWQVSGGEIVVNGASGNLGPLQLSGAAALRLGSGTGSLTFASATLANTNGQLTIYDWQGTGGAAGTGRRIFIQTAPAAAWLAKVNFVGAEFDAGALRLASGEIVPIPKPPSVLPANALAQFQAYGTGLTKTIVAVSGQTFSQAMRLDTTQKPAQAYNSGVVLHTSEAVATNDNLLARFWIRRVAPASGSAQVQFNFELASGTFEKSVQFPVTLTNDQWQLKSVKFKSLAAYAAGAAEVSFWAGYGVQTVEIGGLEVLNYRGTTPP